MNFYLAWLIQNVPLKSVENKTDDGKTQISIRIK